jgi:hypothetical protein
VELSRIKLCISVLSLRPGKCVVTSKIMIKSRRMTWAGHVARMGEKKNAYRILVGKPKGKSPLGRSRRKWLDNIRMVLGEIG